MIFHFTKKSTCGSNCHDKVLDALVKLIPETIPSVNMHLSISHGLKPQAHEYFITYYTDGYHENYRDGKIIKTKFNENQSKFTGNLPSEKELKKVV